MNQIVEQVAEKSIEQAEEQQVFELSLEQLAGVGGGSAGAHWL